MPKEQEGGIPRLSAIRFDYEHGALIFEVDNEPVAQIPFPTAGVIFPAPSRVVDAEATDVAPLLAAHELPAAVPDAPQPSRPEQERTVTLSGKLKSKPQAGKPDRSGKPTAWARFAAHVEEENEAHYFLATFHRHTARIALGLSKEAQVTVEGYPHPSGDPGSKRLDTFSVINLVQYPGKPPRRSP